MNYNKKINKILIIIILLCLIYLMKNWQTYSKYYTELDGNDASVVAKWNIKIGENSLNGNNDFSNELVLEPEKNKNVIEGKIAPGASLSTKFSLDCLECETSLKYIIKPSQIKCDGIDDNRFIVTSIEDEKNTIKYDAEEDYYYGIINVRDTYRLINIKVTVKWNNDDNNNALDTNNGVNNSIITVPISVKVEQIN